MIFNSRLYPDGLYVRSPYWKKYKASLLNKLTNMLFQVTIGMVLGDASLYMTKMEGTKLKMEQGYKHKKYVEELCSLFKDWTFYKEPYAYVAKKGKMEGEIKRYSFCTFAHPAFYIFWELFIVSGKKTYKAGTILKYLDSIGLSYWVADDGSLHKKSNEFILHTQSFSYSENLQMCEELHKKFLLHAKVVSHKKKYWVIYIPASDASLLRTHLKHLPVSMTHKMPKTK